MPVATEMYYDRSARKLERLAFSKGSKRFERRTGLISYGHNVGFVEVADWLATHRAQREKANFLALAATKQDGNELGAGWCFGNGR